MKWLRFEMSMPCDFLRRVHEMITF